MRSVILKKKELLPSLLWRVARWYISYCAGRRPRPLAAGLYITSRCNCRCTFCGIWRKDPAKTLSLPEASHIVDELSGLGCFYFSITGGEPLLVDYLDDLLAHARKSRISYLHLVTNGYLLDDARARSLAATGIDEISISIDGPASVHDEARGVPGSYAKAVQAVLAMKRAAPQVTVVLNSVIRPDRPRACLHTLELARRYDVYLKVQPQNRHPSFDGTPPVQNADKHVSRDLIAEVVSCLKQNDRVVNSRPFLNSVYNFLCKKERYIFNQKSCLFGYHHVEFLEDGSVFPCLEGLNWTGGFSREKGLRTMLASVEYRQRLAELKRCNGCRQSCYICYYEPRISFPLSNFLKFRWSR